MARPEKCKRICHLPARNKFFCQEKDGDVIMISIEEFEAIRLIDHIGLTQEQCAAQMHVARTTIQRLYTDARKKVADFLINGSSLEICGGNYTLCENNEFCCKQLDCSKKQCGCSCDYRVDGCQIAGLHM